MIDSNKVVKDRTVCKSRCNKDRRKNIRNISPGYEISTSHQHPKIYINNKNNQTVIIGFSNCGEIYLMNYILLQKQEPIYKLTTSLNQYPNTEAQTSDGNYPLENYENSTFVFDDMLLSRK